MARVDAHHLREHLRVSEPLERVGHPVEQRRERVIERAGRGNARGDRLLEAPLELEQHVILGREVEVEGRP